MYKCVLFTTGSTGDVTWVGWMFLCVYVCFWVDGWIDGCLFVSLYLNNKNYNLLYNIHRDMIVYIYK